MNPEDILDLMISMNNSDRVRILQDMSTDEKLALFKAFSSDRYDLKECGDLFKFLELYKLM